MSSIELVTRYLGERARPSVFVPLAVLIAETAWLAAPGSTRSVSAFGLCAAQALLLVLALRVWDDVQDRTRDAVQHPERITVRASRTGPLIALSLSLAAGGGLLLLGATVPLARVAILASIVVGLLLWYRTRPTEPSLLSAIALLAKYPALAIALAPGLGDLAPMRAAAAAGVLYLVACTYEYLEDRHRGIS
jgi:hypothetical protein